MRWYHWTILALLFIVILSVISHDNVKPIETIKTDTIFVSRVDTIIDTLTQYKYKHTIDTLYIESENGDSLKLPIIQKHYSNPNIYNLWVSGVEPLNLDSINVYQKTEYKTITNTITREIYPQKMELFVLGGVYKLRNDYIPNVGIYIKPKSNWIFGANISLNRGDIGYGASVGYKIY